MNLRMTMTTITITKKCVCCGKNIVYVAPNGHVSVKCATCLFDDFVELGVIDRRILESFIRERRRREKGLSQE